MKVRFSEVFALDTASFCRHLAWLLIAFFTLFLPGCHYWSSRELPELGQVPRFTLVDQSGQPFDSSQLEGSVYVVNFIFTTCKDVCPRMTLEMKKIHEATKDLPNVRFVSITVDPENDTPEVLRQYALSYGAEQARWSFLTGRREEIEHLMNDIFHLGKVSLDHSTRFVLVDHRGTIRGYYSSQFPEEMNQLLQDLRDLARQAS